MNLFKKIRIHLPYSPDIKQFILSNANEVQEKLEVFPALDDTIASLNVIQTRVKNVKNDAQAIQTLSNALSFCTHLQEYQAGYINKEDESIASNYLLEKALSNEKAVKSIEEKLAKIKED